MSDIETKLRLFNDPRLFHDADVLMQEAANTIAALQAQLAERDQRIDRIVTQSGVRENDLLRRISEMGAERDKTILDQQAHIAALQAEIGKMKGEK